MKNGSILINTARGPIVNEEDLYNELINKRIFAAFDVFLEEPYVGKLKEFYPRFFINDSSRGKHMFRFLKRL